MTETILQLLTRLSEAGDDAILSGEAARPFFGPAFDRLLRARVLVENAPLDEWDLCYACECGLVSRPIRQRGDRFRAECPLDANADVELDANDLRAFRIDPAALAVEMASVGGFLESPTALAPGLWHLGTLPSGRELLLAFERRVLDRHGLIPIIRDVARASPVTLLAPQMQPEMSRRFHEAGIDAVETTAVLVPNEAGAKVRLDQALLEPLSSDPELIVRVGSGEIQWRGRSIVLSHQLFPVFRRLMEKARSRDPVASRSFIEDSTGREAKDLVRELRAAFRSAGMSDSETRGLIITVRGRGYRLGIDASGISVRD